MVSLFVSSRLEGVFIWLFFLSFTFQRQGAGGEGAGYANAPRQLYLQSSWQHRADIRMWAGQRAVEHRVPLPSGGKLLCRGDAQLSILTGPLVPQLKRTNTQ